MKVRIKTSKRDWVVRYACANFTRGTRLFIAYKEIESYASPNRSISLKRRQHATTSELIAQRFWFLFCDRRYGHCNKSLLLGSSPSYVVGGNELPGSLSYYSDDGSMLLQDTNVD